MAGIYLAFAASLIGLIFIAVFRKAERPALVRGLIKGLIAALAAWLIWFGLMVFGG